MTKEPSSAEPRARFKAHGTFFVPSRGEFVVWGTALSGDLRPGMLLALQLGNLSVTSTIEAVDVVEIDGEPFTAVRIDTQDPDVLEFWRAMRVGVGGEEMLAFEG
ncbi:MAG TPA: hypothetical protein VGK73_24240 [Polyangiaceae bacterium]